MFVKRETKIKTPVCAIEQNSGLRSEHASYVLYDQRTFAWSSSSFEGYPLQVRHKQHWGRGFIVLRDQLFLLNKEHHGFGTKNKKSDTHCK